MKPFTKAIYLLFGTLQAACIIAAALYLLDIGDESSATYFSDLVVSKLTAAIFAGCAWIMARARHNLMTGEER